MANEEPTTLVELTREQLRAVVRAIEPQVTDDLSPLFDAERVLDRALLALESTDPGFPGYVKIPFRLEFSLLVEPGAAAKLRESTDPQHIRDELSDIITGMDAVLSTGNDPENGDSWYYVESSGELFLANEASGEEAGKKQEDA